MSPELTELLERARRYVDNMTPEERFEMFEAQRRGILEAHRKAPEIETRVIVMSGSQPVLSKPPAAPQPDYKAVLLNLCASAGLADHMGDMAEDVWQALKQVGIEPPEEVNDLGQLGTWLGAIHGATTVWGTSLTKDGYCNRCWEPDYVCECGE